MKNTKIICFLVLTVVALAWYTMLHLPGMARLDTLYSEIGVEEQKLLNSQQALVYFAPSMEKYDKLRTLARQHGVYLSGPEEAIALYQALDALCSQPGLDLEEITPSLEEMIKFQRERQNGNSVASVPIRIKIQGRYKRLVGLIETIERHPYFDNWLTTQINGSEQYYPNCLLQAAFAAKLGKSMEVAGLE